MSHRVTVQTEIKNKDLAIQALKSSGYAYTEQGDTLRITSGNLARAVINLTTGSIDGDTDHHTQNSLGLLRQAYGEALFREEAIRRGTTILSRDVRKSVNGEQEIVLRCRTA